MANTSREGTSRDLEGRDSDKRQRPWEPVQRLPAPKVPEGKSVRWVRTKIGTENDDMNVSQALREGWVPANIKDHPEMRIIPDINSRFEGNIEVGGLLLCFRDKEITEAEEAYQNEIRENQMKAVDNNLMKNNDARMPLLKPERHSVTNAFGKGS